MSAKIPIVVALTGLNNTDNPGAGIPVARSLKESQKYDVKIIGLSYNPLDPGLYLTDWVDKNYQLPLPNQGKDALLERLTEIQQLENIEVLIPNFDAEIPNFIDISADLRQIGIRTFLPELSQFNDRQKENLSEFGQKSGIKIPQSQAINSVEVLSKNLENTAYPFFMKGRFYDAQLIFTVAQAFSSFYQLSATWGLPVILQERIEGTDLNVTAIGDGNGKCLGAVQMRKMYVTDKGKAWAGVSIFDTELENLMQQFFAQSKWKGGCELEIIKSADGQYFLLEVNPRFPAWIYLATACRQNHPEMLLDLALEKNIETLTKYDIGKMFIRYSMDNIVDVEDFGSKHGA